MKLPELPGYQYDELIGEGACGVAVRCTYQGRETRVVKFLKAQSINPGLVAGCLRALSGKERHPAIAEVHGFNLSEYPYYYIVPFYGEKRSGEGAWLSRSLEDVIGDLTAAQALELMDQIAEGLAYAHRLEVIHAGLKPANVFLAGAEVAGAAQAAGSWQVKIADWGLGYLTGLQYLEMGDLGFYASPEQLDNGNPANGAGKRWDVYSFGVISYLLLTGRLPRLEQQYQAYLKENHGLDHVPAAAFGTVLDQPERYVDWIVEEEAVRWPQPAASEAEAKRREVIERCLAVDPRERFPDMRDVVAAFAECDHRLALLELERQASDGRRRVLGRAARWQKAAAAAAVLSLCGAGAAAFFFAEWRLARKEITETKAGAQQQYERLQTTVASKEEEKEETQHQLDQVKAETDEMRERMREQMREQMRHARQALVESQDYGDRFFELVLENRDSDVPGFSEERRKALAEAATYYESLLQVYGTAADFIESAAKAARFLGEIHYELGNYTRAEAVFLTAKTRLEHIRANARGSRPDVVRVLAVVNSRLAEIAHLRKQPQDGLVALEDAVELWLRVSAADPENPEPAVEIGNARILQATLHRRLGQAEKAKQALQEALRIFLALQPQFPQDHRVAGGMAHATSATADLMRLEGDAEGAAQTYRKASELFAEAIKLNAAVSDFQLGLAVTLAEVALAEDDVEKLTASASVLGEIAAKPENRHRVNVFTALSECYGALAQKQRDGNQSASAIEWETNAIAFLQPLVSDGGPGAAEELRYALAERLCSLANLQADGGKHAEARDSLRSANALIEQLLALDGTNPAYRRLYAQAQGQLGFASAQAGDKSGARQHYENARSQWEAYTSANPQDSVAAQALEWTRSQLGSL